MHEATDKVFKIPMNATESSRLVDLVGKNSTSVGFPLCSTNTTRETKGFKFFTYHRYLPPLSAAVIKQNLFWYIQSVVDIVDKLHKELYIAHLDIRRENICVSLDGSTLVLIDLDRSDNVNENAQPISSKFIVNNVEASTSASPMALITPNDM